MGKFPTLKILLICTIMIMIVIIGLPAAANAASGESPPSAVAGNTFEISESINMITGIRTAWESPPSAIVTQNEMASVIALVKVDETITAQTNGTNYNIEPIVCTWMIETKSGVETARKYPLSGLFNSSFKNYNMIGAPASSGHFKGGIGLSGIFEVQSNYKNA
jgi:hypothetical protein